MRTLWQLARPTFVPAGFFQLSAVVAQVSVPMFVWRLLRILEMSGGGVDRTDVFRDAIPYVLLALAADIANAFGTHRQRFLAASSGVAMRAAVAGAIYERVLRLTPGGRGGLTTGGVSNLLATDAQKLYEVAAEGHLLWSAPLSVLLVAIMLVVVVGPSMAAGIAILVLFVPAVQAISNRMMEIRRLRTKVTDARVEIVNAMLQGIRVTKLNNYEGRYAARIDDARNEELGLLRREFRVWSLLMAVQFISPVVASAGAFAAYVLVGNVLTTADAFTALLLFNALRFPINYASRLAGKVAQARESARRLSIFMRRETRDREGRGGWEEEGGEGGEDEDEDEDVGGEGGEKSRFAGVEERMNEESTSSTAKIDDSPDSHLETNIEFGSENTIDAIYGFGGENGATTAAGASAGDRDDPGNETREGDLPRMIGNDGILPMPPSPPGGDADDDVDEDAALIIKDGVFYTGDAPASCNAEVMGTGDDRDSGFAVGGVNVSVRPGEVLAVVGPVGSGKSTIINGIIGEIPVSPGTSLTMRGRVAYSSQVAFILNATLRDNILFGNEFDPERYDQVLDACCLRADLEQLSAGDRTEIGERGVTISGGQKQRVSLARVVYSDPDIALFDDPLSALDAGTSRFVFDRLFKRCGGNTLLSKTAVVLVTHSSHFLNQVDRVMVVVDGNVPFCGTWPELTEARLDDYGPKAKLAIESILHAVQENGDNNDNGRPERGGDFNHSCLPNLMPGAFGEGTIRAEHISEALMSLETREHGLTRSRVWTYWFRYAGGSFFTIGVFTLFILEKVFYFFTEWWISVWTKSTESPAEVLGVYFHPQSAGIPAQCKYIQVYCILMTLAFICAFLRTVWIASGAIRCSKRLYSVMTHSVLHSPMVYFETTPIGRLLNRFTYDAEILDVTLVWSMSMLRVRLLNNKQNIRVILSTNRIFD
jgi:ABC-type multidrug transport system fused ATPase/permease subunit